MSELHEKRFPNEGNDYRMARNELLQAEIDLRRQIEKVAELRRSLPHGGVLKEDYLFEQGAESLDDLDSVKQVCFSDLFSKSKNTLVIYSFMYSTNMENACPSCTSILDSLNGSSPHIQQRVNFLVVAKSPIQRIREWAKIRGWHNLHLLSSAQNTYNTDYFAQADNGDQMPILNVFTKTKDGIFHTYATEMLYASCEKDQDPRHVDSLWPIWNMFDLTPEGRGNDWYPKLEY